MLMLFQQTTSREGERTQNSQRDREIERDMKRENIERDGEMEAERER